MAEEIIIDKSSGKEERYQQILPQVFALVETENDLVANLANITSALKYGMDFFWVGFYIVKPVSPSIDYETGIPVLRKEEYELVLGPFQGTVACTRIGFGKGVCGTCWKEKRVIMADDVEKFPGHIACSSASKSEIVLPVFDTQQKVVMVMDIDSDKLSGFDNTDEKYLREIVKLIEEKLIISG